MFRIRLHKDDLNILQKIQEILGVGRITMNGNSCLFTITNVKDLRTVLFPLLDKYHLYSVKWLDYLDFKKAVLFLSESNSTRVSVSQLD
jgi:hypothetical protein